MTKKHRKTLQVLFEDPVKSNIPWKDILKYKGYEGAVKFDEEAGVFHGEVLGTRDVITFQGTSVRELERAFKGSIDDYLAFCRERGEEPDKPFSGSLVIRIAPEVHRTLHIQAKKMGKSLNALIEQSLSQLSNM